MNELTSQEIGVLERLARAWDDFLQLPELHKWDKQEFMYAIHQAQNIVLARPAMRIEATKIVENKELGL